jgi:hypothetical protein
VAAKTMQLFEKLYIMPVAKAIQFTLTEYATPIATAGVLAWMATNLTGSVGYDQDGDRMISSGSDSEQYIVNDITNTLQSLQPSCESTQNKPLVIPYLARVAEGQNLNLALMRTDGSSVQVTTSNSYGVKHELHQAGIEAFTLTRSGNNIYIHPAPPAH